MDSEEETKTLLNVIANVVLNPEYKDEITPEQKKLLRPYTATFDKLLDKRVPLAEKRILKKSGSKYMPIIMDTIGDEDLEYCKPKKPNRKRRDCPMCDTVGLKRLAQHLTDMHGVTGAEKKEWLRRNDSD